MKRFLFFAACIGIAACSTPAQTSRILADLDLAYSVAVVAETVYASLPSADPAVVADLRKADIAARDALAIAHAAAEQGNSAALETALASVRDALAIMGKVPAR